jgi:hypothetical protein
MLKRKGPRAGAERHFNLRRALSVPRSSSRETSRGSQTTDWMAGTRKHPQAHAVSQCSCTVSDLN